MRRRSWKTWAVRSRRREWQGALPFSYHVGGAGSIKVHMRLKMDYAQRTVWDVIGKIPGTELPDEWVVAGNHRDAWVFGAVDPGSGTAAMLEAVHGIGVLLAQGWKPRRTLFFCSWDAEEEGLIGSTEWAEEHAKQLAHAVAYINTDASVSGVHFEASAVPSLKQFIREVTMEVASPKGGSVYDEWKKDLGDSAARRHLGKEFNDAPDGPVSGWRGPGRRSGQRFGLHAFYPAPWCSFDRHRFHRCLRRVSLRL